MKTPVSGEAREPEEESDPSQDEARTKELKRRLRRHAAALADALRSLDPGLADEDKSGEAPPGSAERR